MIFNIKLGTFGGPMRMGDIIACANVVEHFRQTENNTDIKFHLDSTSIQSSTHVQEFCKWMLDNTDYYSATPGEVTLPWSKVNLWDYRDISGDLVKIPNAMTRSKKVVVVPLLDADYNTYRNWPNSVLEKILQDVEVDYLNYDLVVAGANPQDRPGWRSSKKLTYTLQEIMTAEVYIGGDTGLSHFTGALVQGPDPIYYTSSRGLLHTTPLYWYTHKKGQMRTYWLDFENTKW